MLTAITVAVAVIAIFVVVEPLSIATSTKLSHLPPLAVGIVPPSVKAFVVPDDVASSMSTSSCASHRRAVASHIVVLVVVVVVVIVVVVIRPPSLPNELSCLGRRQGRQRRSYLIRGRALRRYFPPRALALACVDSLDVAACPPAAALVHRPGGAKETRSIARRGPTTCRLHHRYPPRWHGDRLGPQRRHHRARIHSSPAPLQLIFVNVVVTIVVGIGRRGEEGDIVAGIGQGGKETSTQPPAVARGGGGAGGLGAQDDSGGEELIVGAFGSMSARPRSSADASWCAALSLLSLSYYIFY